MNLFCFDLVWFSFSEEALGQFVERSPKETIRQTYMRSVSCTVGYFSLPMGLCHSVHIQKQTGSCSERPHTIIGSLAEGGTVASSQIATSDPFLSLWLSSGNSLSVAHGRGALFIWMWLHIAPEWRLLKGLLHIAVMILTFYLPLWDFIWMCPGQNRLCYTHWWRSWCNTPCSWCDRSQLSFLLAHHTQRTCWAIWKSASQN